MSATLRELCEAVRDAWESYRANRNHDLWCVADNCEHALAVALGSAEADDMEAVALAIIAALDTERSEGRAEVIADVTRLADEADARYQASHMRDDNCAADAIEDVRIALERKWPTETTCLS